MKEVFWQQGTSELSKFQHNGT